jgi:hypothetical protein
VSVFPDNAVGRPAVPSPPPEGRTRATALRQRLAELRGPRTAPQPLDARRLAALAANPGCRRRALLDGAGVDKAALAEALGAPSGFGQSQFAFARGHAFESRVKADGGAELLRLVHRHLDPSAVPPAPDGTRPPGTGPDGSGASGPADETPEPPETSETPEARVARTALALRAAAADRAGADRTGDVSGTDGADGTGATDGAGWLLLDHPMLALDVAGAPAFLEPDAVVVHPDGRWTVVEIKSFPVVDGAADPAKVGAAARQAAVYVLALEQVAQRLSPAPRVGRTVLLVCPRNFSNQPTGAPVDVRKQLSVTRRQLARLTRVEDIAAALPDGTVFDLAQPPEALHSAVEEVPAAYAPECLAACELAFHCRTRAREEGAVTALGRSVRGELGGLTTVDAVLAAAHGEAGDPADPAVSALRRAAHLRAEALETAGAQAPGAAC